MIENGVHDITNEEYHSSEGVSRSSLMNLKKSAYHYKYAKDNPSFTMSPAMVLGDALHTAVLEPEEYLNRYCIAPAVNKRTKAGKELYAEFLETVGTKAVLTEEQHIQACDMRDSLLRNEYVEPLLRHSHVERSIYFTHPPTGLQCKARPDAWDNETVIDVKTTADASYRGFQTSAYKFGYFLQAGMLSEALKSLGIEMKKFVFMCVENKAPYASAIYLLDEEAIEYGVAQFNELMNKLNEHLTTNSWPAYDVQVLHLPNYANYD